MAVIRRGEEIITCDNWAEFYIGFLRIDAG